jgi:putative phage-type endonuclease
MRGDAMGIRIIQLKDRNEWLQHRRNYIGGSEISSVVGLNPYRDNVTLWEEKVGLREPEDISEKNFVKYGTLAEEHLRELFKLDFPQYEVEYIENNSVLNDRYPWAAASLDGMLTEKETGRKGVLEIKTTNIVQSIQKERWNHQVPSNYYCQVLFYLAVTEFDFVEIKAQLRFQYGDEVFLNTKHYHIERSEVEEDIAYLMTKGEKFMEHVRNRTKPPLVLPEI